VSQLPTPVGAHAVPDAVPPVGPLPVQRAPEGTPAAPSRTAAVLLADPRPASRAALSVGLRGGGMIDVREAASVAEVDAVIARGVAGDLALVSLAFGPAAERLIGDLRRAGWPRVLATDRAADTGSVIRAFRAGASGVLLGPPFYRRAYPADDPGPIPVLHLSDREIEVLRYVADGRTNNWIGAQLGLSVLTVKSHLTRIGRKLGTGDRAQMTAIALRAGVIG
jgi:DNA-binding NarL/FixJ family response regulator